MSKGSAVEEVPSMESTHDQQPEQREPAPTTEQHETQPEPTAVAKSEPEVIEGEVIVIEPPETSEVPTPPKQKPYWLLIPFAIVLCLLFLAGSYLLPILTPSATVTIIPVARTITLTAAIHVPGRQVAPLTLSQTTTALATGKRHQAATRASGTITFYNGLYSSQTVASGTILTGNDGVQIITNQPALIPGATPPYIGQVTISAHAIHPGSQGNIPAGDINQQCWLTAVKAVNTEAFTGGQNARDYLVVTTSDIASAGAALTASLAKSEQAALNAQLNPGEALITPPCREQIRSDHQPGNEAREVTVTVSETCTGIAYDAHSVDANATQMIAGETAKRFGTGYSLLGDIQISVIHATITDQARGIATFAVKIDATSVYHLSQVQKRHIINLIAGKTKQQAQALVLQEPGIAGVVITTSGDAATLPDNPQAITLVIAERL